MNLPKSIRNFIKTKIFDPSDAIGDLNNIVGWHSVGGSSIYGFYKDHQYENGYSSISKLGNGFASVEPTTIDSNGKPIASNVLDRIFTPNTDMSAYDFREALAVCFLVHDKVRLRVHHTGSKVTALNIQGFTFMEGFSEMITEGKRQYRMQNGDVLTDDEVITLKSVNPDNINGGFSASRAARRWTRLDDYIADYQKGFFENGAVPAGQMVITANTKTEFNDMVDMLQARHKGAGKNNNLTYTYRPTGTNGTPSNATVEWIPFSSQNKDMGLKELFENVNKKIDSVYGVPSEIRGFLSNSNYASVGVAEKIFVKYALYPMTMKVWSKFTHELNRITGGMGVAISFDLPIPVVADEIKVESESKQIDSTLITNMTTVGYSLDTIVDAFELPITYKLLRTDGKAPVIENDKPEVLSAEEARGTPSQPIDAFSKSLQTINDKLDALKVKQIDVVDQSLYIQKMSRVIRDQMRRQVNHAIDKLDEALKSKAYGDTTTMEDEQFTAEMLDIMLPLMAIYGNKQVNTGINLILQAGLTTENIAPFEFTTAQRKLYESYLARVGTGYAEQTAEEIRKILGRGILDGATKGEIEDQLRGVILGGPNNYRVTRLATTEVNTSEARASVYSMQNIQKQTGYNIEKRKVHFGADAPCEFCASLLAESWRNVDDSYLSEGADLTGVEGGVYQNNWRTIDCGDVHANGHCGDEYRVVRS